MNHKNEPESDLREGLEFLYKQLHATCDKFEEDYNLDISSIIGILELVKSDRYNELARMIDDIIKNKNFDPGDFKDGEENIM